jgi:hypothetical protein
MEGSHPHAHSSLTQPAPRAADAIEIIAGPQRSSLGGDRPSRPSSAAAAALRVSTSVVSAVAVGLAPWRWFSPADFAMPPLEPQAPLSGAMAARDGASPLAFGRSASEGRGLARVPEAAAVSHAHPSSVGQVRLEGWRRELGQGAHVPCRLVWFAYPARLGRLTQAQADSSLEAVEAVRSVLLWRNPGYTARVFGAGLYLAICLRQLAKGAPFGARHEVPLGVPPQPAGKGTSADGCARLRTRRSSVHMGASSTTLATRERSGRTAQCPSRRP